MVLSKVQENGTFGTRFCDIFVLQFLGVSQTIVLLELSCFVVFIVILSGLNESDTTSSNISESYMETVEVSTNEQEDTEWDFWKFLTSQEY